jgi:hypothetical protein
MVERADDIAFAIPELAEVALAAEAVESDLEFARDVGREDHGEVRSSSERRMPIRDQAGRREFEQ